MDSFDIVFILLHLSTLLVFFLFIQILRKANKSQIHYAFLSFMGLLLIWCIGVIVETYLRDTNIHLVFFFDKIAYIGICFIPIPMLFVGLIFAHTRINFTWKYLLLLVVPVISTIVLWTNDFHHLFYKEFSMISSQIVYGEYFIVHTLYSYTCIIVGLYHLIYFSIKNSGFFSKQAILIILATLVPLIINILFTLNVLQLSLHATTVAFSFMIICYLFAILKYQFLSVAPVALQKVVDLISDSFIVLNEELKIIDYNKTCIDTFGEGFRIKRNENILDVMKSSPVNNIAVSDVKRVIFLAKKRKKSIKFDKQIKSISCDKYFTIEITPIISDNNYIGTIILLKDITQVRENIETIKKNQAILVEQERLASLGQLIGGIAHNLKTPIMSLSGAIEGLWDLVREYDESIDDDNVTRQDHHEIASEMGKWLEKMKPYCSYMSDVITTVKGQAVQFNTVSDISFTLDELVKRINILMKHELIKYNCIMNTNFQVDLGTEIKGEINNLVQIFDNIIINAIHSYEGKNGIIDFNIARSGDNIEFSIADYGKGIPEDIRSKLFKEMVTTKGKNGTGLGLYMSYSTIKGRFGGNIWFTTKEGKGTTFYISVPCMTTNTNEEAM